MGSVSEAACGFLMTHIERADCQATLLLTSALFVDAVCFPASTARLT
jgi:hypothetical protein